MAITAKFRTRKIKCGFQTVTVEIINNFRHPMTREPYNTCVAYLGSYHEHEAQFPHVQKRFWSRADEVINRALSEGKISQSDAAKVRAKVESRIARHVAPRVAKAKPIFYAKPLRDAVRAKYNL
jgi:hypothetical protein